MSSIVPSPEEKIMSIEAAITWRNSLRLTGIKLVATNGCFDILHRGHVEYLTTARNRGSALVVMLNSDDSVKSLKGPNRPVNSQDDRAYVLAALAVVDGVVVFDSPRCTEIIRELQPDIYVKGGDYNIDNINPEEKAALIEAETDIQFIPLTPGFSTTGTLDKISGKN